MVNASLIGLSAGGGLLLIGTKAHHDMLNGMRTPVDVMPVTSVSIVMKSLNEEMRIRNSIESILNQSVIKDYPEFFEILLVDGGSEDATVEIAMEYPIKVIVTRRGVLHQKNVGVENSSGDIIIFVDSDSYYPEFWVAKILKEFQDDPEVVMVRTPFLLEEDNDRGGFGIIMAIVALARNLTHTALGGGTGVRRVVFDETGMFDESQDCIHIRRVSGEEEQEFALRAESVGRSVYQQNNPFISTGRRHMTRAFAHECIANPSCKDCLYMRDLGVSRF